MKKTLSIITLSLIGIGLISCTKEPSKAKNETSDSTKSPNREAAENIATTIDGDPSSAVPPKIPLTTLDFSETNFNLGEIKKGGKAEHIYEVTNTGTEPLVISAIKSEGELFSTPEFKKDSILPGKKGTIKLSFSSNNEALKEGAHIMQNAYVIANVKNYPIKLTLSADIKP